MVGLYRIKPAYHVLENTFNPGSWPFCCPSGRCTRQCVPVYVGRCSGASRKAGGRAAGTTGGKAVSDPGRECRQCEGRGRAGSQKKKEEKAKASPTAEAQQEKALQRGLPGMVGWFIFEKSISWDGISGLCFQESSTLPAARTRLPNSAPRSHRKPGGGCWTSAWDPA